MSQTLFQKENVHIQICMSIITSYHYVKSIVQLASTAVDHLPPAVSGDCYVDLRNEIAKMCSVKYITLTDHEQAYRMVLHLPFPESAYTGLRKCRHKHTVNN